MRCVQFLLFILIVVANPCVYIQNSQIKHMPDVHRPLNTSHLIRQHTPHTKCKTAIALSEGARSECVCVTLSKGFHPLTSFGSDGKAVSVRLCVHAPVFIFSSR